MRRILFSRSVWLILAIVIIFLDQLSKYFVFLHLAPEEVLPIASFFNLVFIYNSGAAFSFLAQASGWQGWLFGGLAVTVSLAIINWLVHSARGRVATKIALMLILGGAVGNLIDRILYNRVRDFLDFYWASYHFPAFNLADSAICLGALLLLLLVVRGHKVGAIIK